MGFRFYKSISVGKGLRVGVSKTGVGVSAGGKGMRYSVHSSGRTRRTAGVPGSGIRYESYGSSSGKKRATASRRSSAQAASAVQLAQLFKPPLFGPKSEKLYVKGLRALLAHGNHQEGLEHLRGCAAEAPNVLSAYFLAAYALLKQDRDHEAIAQLEPVIQSDSALPDHLMSKYGLDGSVMTVSIPMAITPSVMVEIDMSTIGAALLLAELYQDRGDREKAIGLLENVVDVAPDNPAIALSLAELYHQAEMWDELATMPVTIDNTDDLSAEVLRSNSLRVVPDALQRRYSVRFLESSIKSCPTSMRSVGVRSLTSHLSYVP